MPEYAHVAGDARRHHSRRRSLCGASDVRMKIKKSIPENGLQTRAEKFLTRKNWNHSEILSRVHSIDMPASCCPTK
jgi:hypothetical protein